jgi:hypothetical protein
MNSEKEFALKIKNELYSKGNDLMNDYTKICRSLIQGSLHEEYITKTNIQLSKTESEIILPTEKVSFLIHLSLFLTLKTL